MKRVNIKRSIIAFLASAILIGTALPVYADTPQEPEILEDADNLQDPENDDVPTTPEAEPLPEIANDAQEETEQQSTSGPVLDVSSSVNDESLVISISLSGQTDGKTYYGRYYYRDASGYTFELKPEKGYSFSKTLTVSKNKDYEIYARIYSDSGRSELIAESSHRSISVKPQTLSEDDITVTASADDEPTGSISVKNAARLSYYRSGSAADVRTVEGNVITGLASGKYYVYLPPYTDGDTHYLSSNRSKEKTVSGGGVKPVTEYKINLSGDENVRFGQTGTVVVKEGASKSISIKPVNDATHYIDETSVAVTPAESVGKYSFYAPTGELFIENIKGNITVSVASKEKKVISSIAVKSISYSKGGNYSESNPSIQTTIAVLVKDQNGDPVIRKDIYFKLDEKQVSYTQYRSTDSNGIAEFKYSYGIERETGATETYFNPVFAGNASFEGVIATTQIHLIQNLSKDLVLYEDQIIGTAPGRNDGRVINVPAGYEIWTGEVHQGALSGEGVWAGPVNGEFTGLSAGQHALRAGESVSDDGRTFRFASNFKDFFVPRGEWTVSVDKEASENVIFTGDTTFKAEPGGTVYVPVKAAGGYKISDYTVDKPSYVSGGVSYDEEKGYIVIDGITGSLKLTVKAVIIPSSSGDTGYLQSSGTAPAAPSTLVFNAPVPVPSLITPPVSRAIIGARVRPSAVTNADETNDPAEEADVKPIEPKVPVKKPVVNTVPKVQKIEEELVPLAASAVTESSKTTGDILWIPAGLLTMLTVAALTLYFLKKNKR